MNRHPTVAPDKMKKCSSPPPKSDMHVQMARKGHFSPPRLVHVTGWSWLVLGVQGKGACGGRAGSGPAGPSQVHTASEDPPGSLGAETQV